MKVVYIKKICITANMPGKRQAKKHRKFGISWLMYSKGQILRFTPNTAPLICGACNTQPEGLSTMA